MDILNKIIGLMTKEEVRHFKLYATRAHDKEERKDLKLFDYIRRAGGKFNERKVRKSLYGDGRKNTYSRLKNRLLTEISKSLVTLHWNADIVVEAVHFLSLSILYKQQQKFDIAHYFLRKSELKSQELENLALMDLIYGEFISLSYEITDINPEDYIQKRNENLRTLNRLREIDNVLAAVNYRIRLSQNVGRRDENILEILQKTLDEFANDPAITRQPQFRFRMYNAVSRILLQQRDYQSLEDYLLKTYAEFMEEGLFDRSNHDTKLQMLCYIINALFKNNRIDDSLRYAEKLLEGMNAFGKVYYDKYLFFYYNSLATNYSVTNPEKAIQIHTTILKDPKLSKIESYQFYSRVQLGQMYFKVKELGKSAQNLSRLKLLETYQHADPALKFKIELLEMAVRLEQGEMDVLEYRAGQIRKDFADLREMPEMEKDFQMLNLIAGLSKFPLNQPDEGWQKQARAFIAQFPPDETELFKYHEWLSGQVN